MKSQVILLKAGVVPLIALFSTVSALAQNVGISVPTPINTLDIHRGTARTNTHNGGQALYVTGGAEFRSADATTGLRIGSNDIFASGANTNIDLSLAGKGSTGGITFKTNGIERARITGSGLGIGTTTPNAPLQFSSLLENRKIVLVETAFNNHQYYGFGVNSGVLRYQTDAPTSDHVFYSAFDASASSELMRIKGNGNVGIGTNLPNAPLQFSITAANRKIVMYEAANNDHQFIGFGQNTNSLRYQVNTTTSDHIFYAGASSTTSNELLRIKGNGQLRFTPALINRKLVLYQDGVDNDHQYSGFGVNAGVTRYQIPNTSDSHVFYAGTGPASSNELMRVKGNGNVTVSGVVETENFINPPTLTGGFYNYGEGFAGFGYYKDKMGRVHLKGMITIEGDPHEQVVFTLPVGYRPSSGHQMFPSSSDSFECQILIESDGEIKVVGGIPFGWITLSGISFRAD